MHTLDTKNMLTLCCPFSITSASTCDSLHLLGEGEHVGANRLAAHSLISSFMKRLRSFLSLPRHRAHRSKSYCRCLKPVHRCGTPSGRHHRDRRDRWCCRRRGSSASRSSTTCCCCPGLDCMGARISNLRQKTENEANDVPGQESHWLVLGWIWISPDGWW